MGPKESFHGCPGEHIAAQHGNLVGDIFLSSPEPAVIHDFLDYRAVAR